MHKVVIAIAALLALPVQANEARASAARVAPIEIAPSMQQVGQAALPVDHL